MNAIQATIETVSLAREYIEAAIGDCEPATLTRLLPGATIGSILSIYAHAVQAEDWVVQELAKKEPQLITSGGWLERWGLPAPSANGELDFSQINQPLADIQAYAKARLSSYKTPAYIAFVNELPRNPMGKVLKTDLRRDHGGADNN